MSASQFHVYYIVSFNQEKVLVGAFSVLVKTDGSFAALLVTVTEARRQESDEWRPLLPGHDSQGMKSQITTNCTGGNTNCAVCSKHQEPLPSASVSVFLSNKCHG